MKIPSIGLGKWLLKGAACENVVKEALALGYRHIDTADVYQNHREVGAAIKTIPRKEIFLTTKLYLNDLTPERVVPAVSRILEELQVDYIDLLLIHWPNPEVDLSLTLKAMQEEKQVENIGVSNFVRFHLETLKPFKILMNQVELHPYLQRRELVKEYKKAGIGITAYRPLAKGAFEKDETLIKIGKKYGKTPSQVALKWIVDQGIGVIPKASSKPHLKDNLNIFDFEIEPSDREKIDDLDRGARFCAPAGLTVYDD